MKIKHFMNLLFIYKLIKFRLLWDVFWQHNPNQRNHGSTYLISLMAQFNIQSFVNQVCLVIQFHPHGYPIGLAQVEFIGTLLSSIAFVWFALLLEHQSPLFDNFEAFIEKFNATFGDSNKKHSLTLRYDLFVEYIQLW